MPLYIFFHKKAIFFFIQSFFMLFYEMKNEKLYGHLLGSSQRQLWLGGQWERSAWCCPSRALACGSRAEGRGKGSGRWDWRTVAPCVWAMPPVLQSPHLLHNLLCPTPTGHSWSLILDSASQMTLSAYHRTGGVPWKRQPSPRLGHNIHELGQWFKPDPIWRFIALHFLHLVLYFLPWLIIPKGHFYNC